jgi:hypothetical protein
MAADTLLLACLAVLVLLFVVHLLLNPRRTNDADE